MIRFCPRTRDLSPPARRILRQVLLLPDLDRDAAWHNIVDLEGPAVAVAWATGAVPWQRLSRQAQVCAATYQVLTEAGQEVAA